MGIISFGVQGSFQTLQVSIFQDDICLQTIVDDKTRASSQFLFLLEKILTKNKKNFSDISFIAADQGPGAFTSLRVILATLNGIAFSKDSSSQDSSSRKIKLIGIDGLEALAYETFETLVQQKKDLSDSMIVSLLNAYNNEVHHAVYSVDGEKLVLQKPKCYQEIERFLNELGGLAAGNPTSPTPYAKATEVTRLRRAGGQSIFFTGNGAVLHKDLIIDRFGNQALFVPLETCSSEQVGKMGLVRWHAKEGICSELKPLYLKAPKFMLRSIL